MNTRTVALPLAAAVVAILGACASTPPRNAALEQAHVRYDAARADSQVATLAVAELARAGTSLQSADRALAEREPPSTVDHLAYMASQRVVIAEATASSRAAQAVTASAAAERERTRLAMRTAEADSARRELAASQASARQDRNGDAARIAALESELADLNARETERGVVVTLGDVLFDTGRSRLLPGGSRNVAKLAAFLVKNPDRTASIEGHTDSVGSARMNYALSERRANAVVEALVDLGVARGSLGTRAFGADMPAATNDTAAGRQMNRRVEVVIARSGAVAAVQ